MRCLGCFKETKNTYCAKCKKLLFGKERLSYVLDFDKKEFLSKSLELSTHLSISGVQDKISLKIETGTNGKRRTIYFKTCTTHGVWKTYFKCS